MSIQLLQEHLAGRHTGDPVEGCGGCARPRVSPATPRPPGRDPVAPSGQRAKGRTTPTGRLCGCGCGAPVARRFKPGHDTKLKARLLKEHRNGGSRAEAARQAMVDNGWEKFL